MTPTTNTLFDSLDKTKSLETLRNPKSSWRNLGPEDGARG